MKWFFLLTPLFLHASFQHSIPQELYNPFTMNGKVEVIYLDTAKEIFDETSSEYSTDMLDQYLELAKKKESFLSRETDPYLYSALDKHITKVFQKNVGVTGSFKPWYESILLAYGSIPTTLELTPLPYREPSINALPFEDLDPTHNQFDAILSISALEQIGLGLYGEPFDPDGDFSVMEKLKNLLTPKGLLFLSVPIGKDCLVWNSHRIYGVHRLKALFKGWRIVGYFGFTSEDLYTDHEPIKPVFVLTPK